MKRTKFLALVLVAAVMMMGAGYAYWSETLTITNTVTTGNLAFEFALDTDYADGIDEDNSSDYVDTETAVTPEKCKVVPDGQSVDIDLAGMYPGSTVTTKFELKNTGSLAAKITQLKLPDNTTYSDAIFNYLYVSGTINGVDITSAPVLLSDLPASFDSGNFDPQDSIDVELVFSIAGENVDETVLAEGLTESSAIEFALEAIGTQYNNN